MNKIYLLIKHGNNVPKLRPNTARNLFTKSLEPFVLAAVLNSDFHVFSIGFIGLLNCLNCSALPSIAQGKLTFK